MLNWLREALIEFGAWLLDVLEGAAVILLTPIYAGLNKLVGMIPVPDSFATLAGSMGSVPATVGYVLHMFWIPQGLTLLFGALAIRWTLRRIPLIG
jgi:hypothetical protein